MIVTNLVTHKVVYRRALAEKGLYKKITMQIQANISYVRYNNTTEVIWTCSYLLIRNSNVQSRLTFTIFGQEHHYCRGLFPICDDQYSIHSTGMIYPIKLGVYIKDWQFGIYVRKDINVAIRQKMYNTLG